jgi:hypothetical protein
MTDKESEGIDNIPEVAEKLKLGRRRFLKRLAIAALLGASVVRKEKTEACPCGSCNARCNTCDAHTCDSDTCSIDNVCASDTCTETDYCSCDVCGTTNTCSGSNECLTNACLTVDTCSSNTCWSDACGSDTCTEDDRCWLSNHCVLTDTDCGVWDSSCFPLINTCGAD